MKCSFIEITWGRGDQEFVFGHVEVPNGLPNGRVDRIGEYMNLNSGCVCGGGEGCPNREICELGRPSPTE